MFATIFIVDDPNEKLINEHDELMKDNDNLGIEVQEYKDIKVWNIEYLVKNSIILIMKKNA